LPTAHHSSKPKSDCAQIFSRGLAALSIGNDIERDLLSLVEALHPRALDCADVHDILAAVIWLSIALLAVEPLHGSFRHIAFPSAF
jgi:hypothetical protein